MTVATVGSAKAKVRVMYKGARETDRALGVCSNMAVTLNKRSNSFWNGPCFANLIIAARRNLDALQQLLIDNGAFF
jgi:hypothetical protein